MIIAGPIVGPVDSVLFASTNDLLIAEAGARFVGTVVGGGGTIVLADGTGSISDLGGTTSRITGAVSATITGFGAYVIGAEGRWTLAGTNDLLAGQSLTINGVISVTGSLGEAPSAAITIGAGGSLRFAGVDASLDGSIVNGGLLSVRDGDLSLAGPVSGAGAVEIDFATLSVASFSQPVTFGSGRCDLRLAQSRQYTSVISGFATGGRDVLDLCDIAFVSPDQARFSGTSAGGVLTVGDGLHVASIQLSGDYTGDTFVAAGDGQGGVEIIASATASPSIPTFTSAMAGLRGGSGETVAGGSIGADPRLAAPIAEPLDRVR